MDKQELIDRQQKIIELIRDFCIEKLNDEYLDISERLVKKLGRKRSQPLATGQLQVWAAAVIHAVGTINFLFDKSFKPYSTIDEINEFFGTSKSTTGNKSKQIRDLLKLNHYDNEFSTSSMRENNPYAKLVMVDGFIVNVETLPEEFQEIVRQAQAEGKTVSFTTR
jgi:hypothetical protein